VSNLNRRLEQGLLASREVIFGDNAYINTQFMVTPFKNPTVLQDNYNFYYSQLRITVDCVFGMLVHRWSILRRPLPAAMGIHKITVMTVCLCKLHNFLINQKENIPPWTDRDAAHGMIRGSIPMEGQQEHNNEADVPQQLLHGGEHFEDVSRGALRRARYVTAQMNNLCSFGIVQ